MESACATQTVPDVVVDDETQDVFTCLQPTPATILARRETLQRIKYVEGPLKKIPDSIMTDVDTHFLNGGRDDFSSVMWQRTQRTLTTQDDRAAMFFDKRTNLEIQVSRFGYDKFAQKFGKQIVIASLKDLHNPSTTEYVIIFGGGGNVNREGPKIDYRRHQIGLKKYNVCAWAIWQPIHRRTPGWSSQTPSDVMRAIEFRANLDNLFENTRNEGSDEGEVTDDETGSETESGIGSQYGGEDDAYGQKEPERESHTGLLGGECEASEDETADEEEDDASRPWRSSRRAEKRPAQLHHSTNDGADSASQSQA